MQDFEIRVKKGDFRGDLGGVLRGLGLVWESATPPTHIWERSPKKTRFFFWQLPLALLEVFHKFSLCLLNSKYDCQTEFHPNDLYLTFTFTWKGIHAPNFSKFSSLYFLEISHFTEEGGFSIKLCEIYLGTWIISYITIFSYIFLNILQIRYSLLQKNTVGCDLPLIWLVYHVFMFIMFSCLSCFHVYHVSYVYYVFIIDAS